MPLPRNADPDVLQVCDPAQCCVEDWLTFLGHRWTAAILWQLTASPKRFGVLQAGLKDITPKVLTERLQALEQRGLIERTASQTFPRSVTYAVTVRGHEVTDIISRLEPFAHLPDRPVRTDHAHATTL